jgi:hypothetical protein
MASRNLDKCITPATDAYAVGYFVKAVDEEDASAPDFIVVRNEWIHQGDDGKWVCFFTYNSSKMCKLVATHPRRLTAEEMKINHGQEYELVRPPRPNEINTRKQI